MQPAKSFKLANSWQMKCLWAKLHFQRKFLLTDSTKRLVPLRSKQSQFQKKNQKMNFEDACREHFLGLSTLDLLVALLGRLKHNQAADLMGVAKCSSVVRVANLHALIQPSCSFESNFCLHPILTCHNLRRKEFGSHLDSLGKALCSNEVPQMSAIANLRN